MKYEVCSLAVYVLNLSLLAGIAESLLWGDQILLLVGAWIQSISPSTP